MEHQVKHRERMAEFRKQRKERGMRETTVWLNPDVQKKVERLVAEGKFRNRSDVLNAAIEILD
jgi:hypothetical protein